MKNPRFINYSSYGVLIVCCIFLLIYLYQQYWPITIIEHHFTEAKVLNQGHQVKRGDFLEVEYHYSKYHNIAGVISRMLVNDRIVHLTCDSASLPIGEDQKKILRIYIPTNIFPGRYKLVTHITYPLNGDRKEYYSWVSEWFEVTE